MIHLSDAYLCRECSTIYDLVKEGKCPRCGEISTVHLFAFIPPEEELKTMIDLMGKSAEEVGSR